MGIDFDIKKLEDLGFEFGIEIEEDVEEEEPGKAVEYFKFECTNNRPDLLC